MFKDRFRALIEWWRIQFLMEDQSSRRLFKEGEVWWCRIGMNVGSEIFGKGAKFARPVIVYKKFDAGSFLGIPLTTQAKIGSWYIPTELNGQHRTAILSQVRTLDARRLLEKVGTLRNNEFWKLHSAFLQFYK